MSGLYEKKRGRAHLNLLPLIDVLVMLIFFSFVTMQFRSAATMNITLPKIETAGKNEFKGTVTIGINKEGAEPERDYPALYAAVAGVLAFVFSLKRGERVAPPPIEVPVALRFDAEGRLDPRANA